MLAVGEMIRVDAVKSLSIAWNFFVTITVSVKFFVDTLNFKLAIYDVIVIEYVNVFVI